MHPVFAPAPSTRACHIVEDSHAAMHDSNKPFSCTYYLSGMCQALEIQSETRGSFLFPPPQTRRELGHWRRGRGTDPWYLSAMMEGPVETYSYQGCRIKRKSPITWFNWLITQFLDPQSTSLLHWCLPQDLCPGSPLPGMAQISTSELPLILPCSNLTSIRSETFCV